MLLRSVSMCRRIERGIFGRDKRLVGPEHIGGGGQFVRIAVLKSEWV
jgi:hypothetical protein